MGRAICISADSDVRRIAGEALASAGLTVEHCDEIPDDSNGVAVYVVDRATRLACAAKLRGASAPVVVVGDSLDDDGLITLMLEAPVSHLVEDPHDRDL